MRRFKKLLISTLFIILILLIIGILKIFLIMPDYYVFINDTRDRINGSVIGYSSPGYPIDLEAGKTKLMAMPYGAEVVKANPRSAYIDPILDLWVIKFVWISKLQERALLPLASPEESFKLYAAGWQAQDLNLVLAACAPDQDSRRRCNELFQTIHSAGGTADIAGWLNRAEMKITKDLGEARFYEVYADDESESMMFVQVPNVGWRISEP
ncbi:hypothetical protein EPN28_02895 [Patescibacteria group bacterium]|nr:MAG: hypothetical protein EPN28_02895 [Patescibacteria group bacterium]